MCAMKYPTWEEFMIGWEEFIKGSFGAKANFPMITDETPTFMGTPHATKPDDLRGADAVIIGAPYVATSSEKYAGVDKNEWLAAPKRVRQQSIRYPSAYIQDFDLDVFEHLNVSSTMATPKSLPEVHGEPIARGHPARPRPRSRKKSARPWTSGAIPIVIGQNSPCGSYAIAKPIAERTAGPGGLYQPRHPLGRPSPSIT